MTWRQIRCFLTLGHRWRDDDGYKWCARCGEIVEKWEPWQLAGERGDHRD